MEKKKIKPTEKEIEKTIGGIFDVISSRMEEEDKKSPIFDFISKQIKHLKDPEDFYTMAIFPVERIIHTFIETQFKKDNYLAPEIYLRYHFFENHLSKLCQNLYGNACCVDRARFLLQAALKWKETGEMPIFNWEQKYTFHIPPTGTPEQWMSFIEAIKSLLYGNSVKYCMALKIHAYPFNSKKLLDKIKGIINIILYERKSQGYVYSNWSYCIYF
ncbi:MAG: hypothetical protein PHX21_12585, partial [bacterium]|nr:hypothetical protein [bacterium]